MSSHLDAALELATQGFAVFPLATRDKVPAIPTTAGGHGCLDATTDAERVAKLWARARQHTPDPQVGMACGSKSGGLLVVETDGWPADTDFSALVVQHTGEPFPRTVTVLTGSGKPSLHYYTRLPIGVSLGNSVSKLALKVDTRGEGGYVVAPPSIHPKGEAYHWLRSPLAVPIIETPAWIIRLLTPPPREPRPWTPPRAFAGDTPLARRVLGEECDRAVTAPVGIRRNTLRDSAIRLGTLVAGGELVLEVAADALVSAGLRSGLGQREVEATVGDALEYGLHYPRRLMTRREAAV